jgi:hypothetical protein
MSQWKKKGRQLGTKKKIAIISAYGQTKLKLIFFMLLGGPQNTIKSHLVFTALFCFTPFSVFSSRMSAPHWVPHVENIVFPFRHAKSPLTD